MTSHSDDYRPMRVPGGMAPTLHPYTGESKPEQDLLACIREAQSVMETSMSAMRLARMRIETLEKALEWYADDKNYGTLVCNDGDDRYDVFPSDAEEDCGERARKALGTR